MRTTLKSVLIAAAAGCFCSGWAAETDSPIWKAVATSDNTTYAIKADGTLWAWGDNELGELGQGSTDIKLSSTPLQIGEDNTWKAAFGARGAGFFLKEDGTLWSVGCNEKGLSGVGDGLTKHTSLVQVGTDSDWATIGASSSWCYTVLGIKTDGTLWAWGDGSTFCIGRGNTTSSTVPVQVGTDNDWKAVSIGSSHVLALKTDGSLWGWGFAPYHQLMNSTTNIKVPTRLGNDTWESVYAIDNASFGVKADGTLWAWGDNTRNLLGLNSDMSGLEEDATLPNVDVPTQITTITGKVTAMSGCEYVRVVIADGKVLAWGSNANGALGNGKGEAFETTNNQYSYVPVEVLLPEGTTAATLSSGLRFSALLDDKGTIYGWGSNRWGQMGNYADDARLTFCAEPTTMGVPAPPEPGDYTFDAQSIPSSLADAVKITLTGEWTTADFQKLCIAIGANLGFPPVGNQTLISVDMSAASFAPETSFYVSAGMQQAGVFKMCKALESVKFPTNATAANLVNMQEAFMNCAALSSCDISTLTGVTNIKDAFYGSSISMVNMAAWENVTKSEDAFGTCQKLSSVVLPANFTVGKFLFNSCTALRLIDWSLYAGDTAPVISSSAEIFQSLSDEQQAQITMMVPEAVFESFKADATWSKVNLQAVRTADEGTYYVDGASVPDDLKDARHIILNGTWDSAAFKALCDALGNNASTSGNTTLESVDMSAATIAAGTDLSAQFPGIFGTVPKGIFQNCKNLNKVVMPAPDEAANFSSFQQAFYGCEALTSIDISGCTGLTQTTDAFYNCTALEEVVLPGTFQFASGTFDRCTALKTIDWSRYEGTEAPAFKSGSIPTLGKALTITVPEAAYDSFVANASWNGYNIVKASSSAIDAIEADAAQNQPRRVFDFSGRYITTLAPGQDATALPAGIYIVNGRKVLVK